MTILKMITTVAYALIVLSLGVPIGPSASAAEYDGNNQKVIYWSIGKSDLVVKAGKRLEAGKWDQARRLYKQALNTTLRRNDRFITYINLSVIHNSQKDYAAALKYCNKALKLVPDNWLVYNNRGTAQFGLGKYDLAQQDYAKAITLQPGDEGLAYNEKLAQSKISPEPAHAYSQK